MKICVYAIMRNEQSNVAPWAETTVDADMRFVLDTGSRDRTVPELSLHGIPTESVSIDPFRFDDARNMALALAPEADLYLRLDADERLPDDWHRQIEEVYDPRIPRYQYRVHNNGGIWETIIRDDLHQRQGFRWRYPTHEVLVGPRPVIHLPRFVVEHTSPPERRSHHETNLAVLEAATLEYPGDHRMQFYFARELFYVGAWIRSREEMSKFLAMPDGWGAERAEGYRILAAMDYEPERWLWKAVGECPQRREPWVDLARHFIGIGHREQAIGALNFAYHRNDETLYTTDPQCWGDPFHELMESMVDVDPHEAHAAES